MNLFLFFFFCFVWGGGAGRGLESREREGKEEGTKKKKKRTQKGQDHLLRSHGEVVIGRGKTMLLIPPPLLLFASSLCSQHLLTSFPHQYSCPGGPRLYSFTGLSTKMSPRARLNTLMGYTAPFDRHDWVIDRCGTRVEYVIDFYAGKAATNPNSKQGGGGVPSFYLDVRPKLNSWEGVRMRAARALGMA